MNSKELQQGRTTAVVGCAASNIDAAEVRSAISPGHIDATLRQTLQMLWMILPADRRTPEVVEEEFRRVAERALRDFPEDSKRFGCGQQSEYPGWATSFPSFETACCP